MRKVFLSGLLFFCFPVFGFCGTSQTSDKTYPDAPSFRVSELKSFEWLCSQTPSDEWAATLLKQKLSQSLEGLRMKRTYMGKLFEEEFLSFSKFLRTHASKDLLEYYSQLPVDGALSEMKMSVLAQIMNQKPEIFFELKNAKALAGDIVENPGVSFASPKEARECAKNLAQFAKSSSQEKRRDVERLSKRLIENLR